MAKRLFTSESVTEGHPDKVCDQISDAVLDDILAHDPTAHVACETFTTTGIVTVMGEITTKHYTDIPSIVRRTVERIGYTDPAYGFDYRSCAVMTAIDEQSPDIAMGVNQSYEHQEGGTDAADLIGAGDQGMMFGYACDETDVLMPAPIDLAHKLARQLTDVRKSGKLSWLRPDGKSQVTVEYGDDGKVLSCPAIVVSTQHDPDIALKDLREAVVEEIIKPIIPAQYITKDTKFYVNPTGRFVVGGPVGDTGLTGRKIIVDTYGGSAAHGGGCFSGKDPTKVDRSAAYMARYIAKNLVAAGLCRKCQIELAYAPRLRSGGHLRHRRAGRGEALRHRQRVLRHAPGQDHRAPESPPPHLRADCRLWPLRSHRRGSALGAHRHGGEAQELSVSAGRPFASSVRPPQVLPAAGAFYATAGRPGAGPPHLFMARPVRMKFYTVDKRA